ncbi:M23 family metallopeptidase [Flavobacterium terrae]|uniref:Murein DD-endopeptidase MepM and murein hydrolase activator NlpD, contain LysM domain n=1 Tax=Flavobacterium terrae TaxID=415425 RepID=A0A1M6B695_9FLAO|nr:peptidoglycan DD-metalloendopeptidase family protein [Flavobacterium terrae]SHI44279.1 Murein DD-endopeptidase MepM and murein hydrolase activator NlpD, contain LysM domain [Flavobacterium terrae]
MKKYIALLLVLLFVVSCKEDKVEQKIPVKKVEPIRYDFGFKLNDFSVISDTIRKDDTFGSILQKQNLNGKQIYDVIAKVKDTFNVRIVRLGKPYTMLLSKDKSKRLQYFIYQPDQLTYYVIDFNDSIVKAKKKLKPVTFKRRTVAGELNGSLSETLKNEGVAASLSSKLTSVFKWSIDFFKSQKGDKFAVTFTERYINDTIYDGVDSLECAFFEYKGKKVYAFPFKQNPSDRKVDYYDEEGKALKNFFLKAPLKTINITSRFSKRRYHPVQKFFKPHNGTDYAAPHGTPIMSTANGIVELAGYSAGNGNHVKVKHDKTYSTQYLHMSKILVRKGQHVRQGQIIGKVGSTGLATGPHVCYRFWKNGKQVDALKLKLPNSAPMDKKNLPKFIAFMTPLKRELDSIAAIK